MNRLFHIAVFALSATLAAPSVSQDFNTGYEAFRAQDYTTAFENWYPLAQQGDATAQFGLGLMYADGAGVRQDYEEAVKWFRRADSLIFYGARHEISTIPHITCAKVRL